MDNQRPTALRSSVIEALHPEFAVALEQSKLHERRLGSWINIDRATETEGAGIRYTILLHFPESLARLRPSPVQFAALGKDIELPSIHGTTDRVRDEVSFVPLSPEHFLGRPDPASEPAIVTARCLWLRPSQNSN
jgi:hypothetical protein